MRSAQLVLAAALALAAGTRIPAGTGAPGRDADPVFDRQVRSLLARPCLGSHGAENPKGGLRLDRLTPDVATPRPADGG